MTRPTPLEQVASDAGELADMLRWAHGHGYLQERRDKDRPAAPKAPRDTTSDAVPGARYDIGVGSHRARTAVVAVVPWITKAELDVFVARRVHGPTVHRRVLTRQRLGRPVDALTLAAACDGLTAICDDLRSLPTDPAAAKALRDAARQLNKAWGRLSQVFTDRSDLPEGVGVPNCWNCRIRRGPESKTGKPTEGGRCATCARYRRRSKDGLQERPRSLDADVARDARAAQAKRRARHEGWGDESLSLTSQPPIVGERATPPAPPGVTLREAAALTGVPHRELRRMIDAGELTVSVVAARTYIDDDTLEALATQGATT